MLAWDPIAPGENLLSSVNWSLRLAAGDTITTSNWSTIVQIISLNPLTFAAAPPGITQSPAPTVFPFTNIYISGITNAMLGTTLAITNTITTGTGQTEVETASFVVAIK